MLPTHPTRTLAPLLLALAVLALPATATAQNAEDAARDHLAGLYYQSEKEGYTELVRHARVLTAAIVKGHEWHLVHHQLHMPEEDHPYQVATRYEFVQEPVLEMKHDGPEFVLKFRVLAHDSHHKQQLQARGVSFPMDPTDELIVIQLDDETPGEFRGNRLARLEPESVSEWRDGAVLPDEMVTLPWGGWPPAAALEEARAERAVDAFREMVDVWEVLLTDNEKLREMEARSYLAEMAANQKLRKQRMESGNR